MARPVLAFLTDFGLHDHYVGAMKGAALDVCPDATLVDITHDIPPQDIVAAAYELAAAVPYFPTATVFVVVVDPGVGGGRRGIAVEIGGRRFVGPDNGLLTMVLARAPREAVRAVEIVEPRFVRPTVSRTFEGRDRFAPAAAWLAAGVRLEELGPPVTDLTMLDLPAPAVHADAVIGTIVRIDRFGNLMTNVDEALLGAWRGEVVVHLGSVEIAGLVRTYADAAPGACCALVGSSGALEVAVNGGSAAAMLRLERGAVVQVRRRRGA